MSAPRPKEESEVERCRHVRDELDGHFMNSKEALAYLAALERKAKRRGVRSKVKPPGAKHRRTSAATARPRKHARSA